MVTANKHPTLLSELRPEKYKSSFTIISMSKQLIFLMQKHFIYNIVQLNKLFCNNIFLILMI